MVSPGQILAKLDTADIDAEIAVAEADRVKLEAEVRAELALVEQRLDTDVEALQRALALQREEQLQVNAEAKAIDGELGRVRKLVEDRQAVLDDLSALDLRHAAASALVAEKPRTVGLLSKQIKAAEERRQRLTKQESAEAAKLEADLGLAQKRIERLQQRRNGYMLRATHEGRVAAVDKQPGEVAQPGQPVIELVSARDRVVACVPERIALGVREGDAARLWVRGQDGEPLRGVAQSLGPTVSELPQRCWRNPRIPQWGREVTIALEGPVELVAGQAFDIALEPSKAPPPAARAATPPAAPLAAEPVAQGERRVVVPASLAARSRFEPSGLLARASESRYLVVSDDTGRDGDEGAPWLFSMSTNGAVDAEPIVLGGIDEINDVESITQGDAGEIYLLSSQSYSKKGKRKPTRTALLRLRPDGAGFRVDGEVHLAEMLDASPERAASLGLPEGTRALDIEGMAFQKGALYLGLKAPLDRQGDAMIWRVEKPSELFDGATQQAKTSGGAARLDAAGLSPFAHVRVDVELLGKTVPGGISDLFFLPDGSLAITSTPSTAEGAAGALFRVDKPVAGALSPRLVTRFPDQKPEGIAASFSSPDKLMFVFDAGAARALVRGGPVEPVTRFLVLASASAALLSGCFAPMKGSAPDRAISLYHEAQSERGALAFRPEARGARGRPQRAAPSTLAVDEAVRLAKENSARLAELSARVEAAKAAAEATDQYRNPQLRVSQINLDDIVDGKARGAALAPVSPVSPRRGRRQGRGGARGGGDRARGALGAESSRIEADMRWLFEDVLLLDAEIAAVEAVAAARRSPRIANERAARRGRGDGAR